jgi:hypothetical protein
MAHTAQPGPQDTSKGHQRRLFETERPKIRKHGILSQTSVWPAHHQEQPTAWKVSDDPTMPYDEWVIHIFGSKEEAERFSAEMRQRAAAQKTDVETRKDLGDMVFWQDVRSAFALCRSAIEQNSRLSRSDAGKDWLAIIERRLQWLEEDRTKLQKRLVLNAECGTYGKPSYIGQRARATLTDGKSGTRPSQHEGP